jgi:hypothetical protein
MRTPKPKRPKRVSYEVIHPESVIGHPLYARLETLVAEHHPELGRARIALAWCTSWKPDVDGRVTLGKCKRASDLDRELAAYDFVILLRRSFWLDDRVSDAQRTALLDHELCHAALKYDEKGEPVEDERGRLVWRTRRHDLEEFSEVVQRHGMWNADLERFAAALRRGLAEAFEPCDDCCEMNGWITITDDTDVRRVKRCPCYIQWLERHSLLVAEQAAS